jgi:hypothetical protein
MEYERDIGGIRIYASYAARRIKHNQTRPGNPELRGLPMEKPPDKWWIVHCHVTDCCTVTLN